jgi:hypothetical protein
LGGCDRQTFCNQRLQWYHKLQNLGLAKFYIETESELGKWKKHISGLLYLPPEEIGDCFLELMEVIPINENLQII